MRTIAYLIRKEFIQISRDKVLRTMIVLIPILQMLVLVYAATFEIKRIDLHFVDQDRSAAASELINQFKASSLFRAVEYTSDVESGKKSLDADKADVVCVIPNGFGESLSILKPTKLQFLLNSINGSMAELSLSYCKAVVNDFSSSVIAEAGIDLDSMQTIDVQTRFWYNPELNYQIFMAPGILALLVTIIGWMLTGMNLVREKETGTIEQLNVTPIKKYQFIAGKLLPFLIIGLFDLAFGLLIAWIQFKVPIEGSLLVLFTFTTIYLVAVLGIGLLISTISATQQQVMFVSFFFVMIFVLMSGLFTAADNMPEWGQKLNIINPMAYYIKVIRMVLLKGSGFADISHEMVSVVIYAVCTNGLAIWRYRKVN